MDNENELPPEEAVEVDLSKPEQKPPEVEKQEPPPPEPEPEPEPEAEEDDGTVVLQQQLQAAQQAIEQAQYNQQQAERRHYEAEVQRYQAEQRAYRQQESSANAQYDAILNAIGAAQAEGEAAERDLAVAVENSDPKAIAEAQRRISRSETRLVQLEDGKAAFEMRQEEYQRQLKEYQRRQQQAQYQQQQAPQQPQRQPTIQEAIMADSNFLPLEKEWLVKHPEVLTDQRKNAALQHAFYTATQDKGLQRGSREYFKFMEETLGYAKTTPKKTTTNFAAPVSRDSLPQEVISGSRVTLSPSQREAAKLAGISDVEYARQLIKIRKAQKDGLIQ